MQSVAERLECLPESRIEVRDGVGLVVSKPEYVDAKGVTVRRGTQEECVVGVRDVQLEGKGPGRGVGALRRAVRIEASPESRDRFLHPPIARCEGTHSSVNHVGISRSSIWLSSGRPMKPRSQNSCVTGAPSFPVLTKGPRMVSIGSGTSAASHLTTPRSSRSLSAFMSRLSPTVTRSWIPASHAAPSAGRPSPAKVGGASGDGLRRVEASGPATHLRCSPPDRLTALLAHSQSRRFHLREVFSEPRCRELGRCVLQRAEHLITLLLVEHWCLKRVGQEIHHVAAAFEGDLLCPLQ